MRSVILRKANHKLNIHEPLISCCAVLFPCTPPHLYRRNDIWLNRSENGTSELRRWGSNTPRGLLQWVLLRICGVFSASTTSVLASFHREYPLGVYYHPLQSEMRPSSSVAPKPIKHVNDCYFPVIQIPKQQRAFKSSPPRGPVKEHVLLVWASSLVVHFHDRQMNS